MYYDLLVGYSEQSLRTALENGSWVHLKLKRVYLQNGSVAIQVHPDHDILLTPRHEVLTPVIKWVSLPPFVMNKRRLHQITINGPIAELMLDSRVSVMAVDEDDNVLSDVTWDVAVSSLELRHALTNRILVDGKPFFIPVESIDTFNIWREYHYATSVNPNEHSEQAEE